MQKTWFVTGASRGFGAEIAKAAVRSGDRVVATGRKRTAVGEHRWRLHRFKPWRLSAITFDSSPITRVTDPDGGRS